MNFHLYPKSTVGFFLLIFLSLLRGFRFLFLLVLYLCISFLPVVVPSLIIFLPSYYCLFYCKKKVLLTIVYIFVDYSHWVRKTKSYTELVQRFVREEKGSPYITPTDPVSLRTHTDTLLIIEVLSMLFTCWGRGGGTEGRTILYLVHNTHVSLFPSIPSAKKYLLVSCIACPSMCTRWHDCLLRICLNYPRQGVKKNPRCGGGKIWD